MKPEPENRNATKRGSHAWQIAAAAVLCVALVVLLVLPGFLAAWFCRVESARGIIYAPVYSINGVARWDSDTRWEEDDPPSWEDSAVRHHRWRHLALLPSCWAMSHSMAVRRFYSWEYHLAGGEDVAMAPFQ